MSRLPRQELTERSHYVYRLYDATGQLLYVGCTSNVKHRMTYGHHDKPWWPEVAITEISGPMSRHDAHILERTIIRAEKPLHNKQTWSPHTVRMLWRHGGKPANSPGEMFRETREGVPA